MGFAYYQKAARAFSPVLQDGVTFTKAWFMKQDGMTPSYWHYAHLQGLRPTDGYAAVAAGVSGRDRGKLLTVVQAGTPGAHHLRKDENDRGPAYQMTPFGRFTYGPLFEAHAGARRA